jgi:cytochrome c553
VRVALLSRRVHWQRTGAAGKRPDANLGRNLAATCTYCHGTDGRSAGGTVALAGMPKEQLVQTMNRIQVGRQAGHGHAATVKGYTEQQVELIGEYFAKQQ